MKRAISSAKKLGISDTNARLLAALCKAGQPTPPWLVAELKREVQNTGSEPSDG